MLSTNEYQEALACRRGVAFIALIILTVPKPLYNADVLNAYLDPLCFSLSASQTVELEFAQLPAVSGSLRADPSCLARRKDGTYMQPPPSKRPRLTVEDLVSIPPEGSANEKNG